MNSGSIPTLNENDTLLYRIWSTSSDKVQLEFIESTEPNTWQAEDPENRCKRKGKDGEVMLHNGKKVFMNAQVVSCYGDTAAEQTFLKTDTAVVQNADALDKFADVAGLNLG